MPHSRHVQDKGWVTDREALNANMTEARTFAPQILAISNDIHKIKALSVLSIAKAWACIRAAEALQRNSARGRGA